MKKIKCLIADDEQLSREILESYIYRVSHTINSGLQKWD